MNRIALPSSFLALLGLGFAFAPPAQDHVSVMSRVIGTYTPRVGQPSAEVRVSTAKAFLDTLEDELRSKSALSLSDPERAKWTNLPSRSSDGGARLGDLSEAQMRMVCDLLASSLSRSGYAKMRDIMLADDKLLRNGEPRVGFGAEEFRIVIFGKPSTTEPWALQLDGHHIGLNLAFQGEEVTLSPSFIGTQPASFQRKDTKVVPMRGEVDEAFRLVNKLTDEQRAKAVVSESRGRIVSGPGNDGKTPKPIGLPCKEMDDQQRSTLLRLLRQYVGNLPAPNAKKRMKALEAEIDEMHFAWSGPTDNPSDVSYRVQGPSVLIEYACQDLGGNPLDHLHSMYRDPRNEYGAGF